MLEADGQPVLSDTAVAAFLLRNPDFFQRRARLLEILKVPDGSGETSSLQAFQLRRLQSQVQDQRNALEQLSDEARRNELLWDRLHRCVLDWLTARPDADRTETLLSTIRQHFDAEHLILIGASGEPRATRVVPIALLESWRARGLPWCGRPGLEATRELLGPDLAVASIALVDLAPAPALLCFASADEERYQPHAGTDLLQRLGELAAHWYGSDSPGPA